MYVGNTKKYGEAKADIESGEARPVPLQALKIPSKQRGGPGYAQGSNARAYRRLKHKKLREDVGDGGDSWYDAYIGTPVDWLLDSVWYNQPCQQALERWRETLLVITLTAVWYSSAIFAITTSKMIMLTLPLPFTLCTSQFVIASCVTMLWSYLCPLAPTKPAPTLSGQLVPPSGTTSPGGRLASNPSDWDLHGHSLAEIGNENGTSDSSDSGSINSGVSIGPSPPRRNKLLANMSIRDRSVSSGHAGEMSALSGQVAGAAATIEVAHTASMQKTVTDSSFNLNAGVREACTAGAAQAVETDAKYALKARGKVATMLFRCSPKPLGAVLYLTAFSYTCGFLFTNMAFSVVTASFAETVKSAEPLTSALMAYVVLREVESWPTYACLIPICVGVACSCLHEDSFNIFGFSCAALSNVCFSARAVYAKKIMKSLPGALDEVSLFGYVSIIGLCMLVPVAIYMEGNKLYDKFFVDLDDSYVPGGRQQLLLLVMGNGVAYTCYNLMSFLVLTRTNMVTHAILNCIRRVFVIIFTCYFFDIRLSNTNLAGVGVAITGVIAFGYFKGRPK